MKRFPIVDSRFPIASRIILISCTLPPAACRFADFTHSFPTLELTTAADTPSFRTDAVPLPSPTPTPYNHTASLAALPDGTLLVAWTAGFRELADDTAIYLSRRDTNGIWSTPVVLADTPGRPDANCVLFLDDANTLHLYYAAMFGATFCESLTLQRHSTDGGLTWSDPTPLLPAICTLLRNKPLQLDPNRWLLPAYIEGVYASQFWFSGDRGRTWLPTPPLVTLPNNLQPALVARRDGSLLALMRGNGGFIWQAESCDNGFLWLPSPRADLPNPNSGLDLLRHSSGILVLACNDSAIRRSPLVVRASLDDGRTWLPPRVIAEAAVGQLSYPTLAESPDGLIHLAYSNNLVSISHAEFNPAWLLSSDP